MILILYQEAEINHIEKKWFYMTAFNCTHIIHGKYPTEWALKIFKCILQFYFNNSTSIVIFKQLLIIYLYININAHRNILGQGNHVGNDIRRPDFSGQRYKIKSINQVKILCVFI